VKREEASEDETMSRRTLEMVIGRLEQRGLRRGVAGSPLAALLATAGCGKVETAPRTPPPVVEVDPRPGDRVVVDGIQTLKTGTVVQPRPVETDRVLQPNPASGGD